MPGPDDIFGDPRTFPIFWATFPAELEPIDLTKPEHLDRVKKVRVELTGLGYGEHAVKFIHRRVPLPGTAGVKLEFRHSRAPVPLSSTSPASGSAAHDTLYENSEPAVRGIMEISS